jgi:hypothetical protein
MGGCHTKLVQALVQALQAHQRALGARATYLLADIFVAARGSRIA